METLPPNMQELVVTGYEIRRGPDPTMCGLAMQTKVASMLYILTSAKLHELARDLQKMANEMQKPS